MKEATLKNINKSPVRTWRWLGVNDISLDEEIPNIKKYDKKILQHIKDVDYKNIDILYSEDSSVYPLLLEKPSIEYGVSENLVNLAKNDSNTGVFIRGRVGGVSENPIIINYESDKENHVIVDNNIILAEEGCKLTLLFNYKSTEDEKVFHNGLTRIYAAKGSEVNVIKVQLFSESSYNFDSTLAVVEEEAKVNIITVELGSKNTVVNYVTDLKGPGSNGTISSMYLGDKERVIDLNYVVNHIGRKTVSNIAVKGALLDKAKKIFRGTLDFKRGSAGSVGSEEEYAVLLSPNVRNRAVPLLLCSEEDVQGAHAASSGKVDEEMLFYIMSRGFSENEAKKLIIEAAFNPILEKISLGVIREEISKFITDRLS